MGRQHLLKPIFQTRIQKNGYSSVEFLGSIDILVNNAAKFTFGAVEDVSQEEWEDILKVNVIGYSTCVKKLFLI